MEIVCFGDSNTWGYDPRGFFGGHYDRPWPDILADKLRCNVKNLGENGREIPGKTVLFSNDADLVIIMLGTNDLLQGLPAEAVCRRMGRFLESVNRDKILLIAPPSMKRGEWVQDQNLIEESKTLATCYQRLAKRLGIRFSDAGDWNVSLAFDGVHFTEDGHKAFAEGLIDYLKKNSFRDIITDAPDFL